MSCLFVCSEITGRQGEARLACAPPCAPGRLPGLSLPSVHPRPPVTEAALGEGWAEPVQLTPHPLPGSLEASLDCENPAEGLAGSLPSQAGSPRAGALPALRSDLPTQAGVSAAPAGPTLQGLPLGIVSASCFVGLLKGPRCEWLLHRDPSPPLWARRG